MYWHFRLGQLYPSEVSQKCTSFICYLICLFDERFHNTYLQICPLTCSHFWRCSQHVFTSLASPRPVFASLDLSQLPYRCPSLAMSSGWSSPEFLLSPESLSCPWSSLSLEFLVLGVLQRSFARLPPVFLELSVRATLLFGSQRAMSVCLRYPIPVGHCQ